jgi:hypothetical protein
MVSFAAGLAAGVAALALLYWVAAAGFRNGDRATDAKVSAVLRNAGQPDESRPVVVATVRNPSGTPVLTGLSVRRARLPYWLTGALSVTVPRRTRRRKFRPGGYACVGIVPGETTVRFMVPVRAAAPRYRLTAAVGQSGGRLRVYRLRVAPAHLRVGAELTVPFGENLSN